MMGFKISRVSEMGGFSTLENWASSDKRWSGPTSLTLKLCCWTSHLPQMENMRTPKAVFYEDLRQANVTEEPQTTLSQRKTGRVLHNWRAATNGGFEGFGAERTAATEVNHRRRKESAAWNPPELGFPCPTCATVLHSHQRPPAEPWIPGMSHCSISAKPS